MAQHDYILENQPGAAFRGDLNEVLQAIVSNNSGADEPSPSYPFQWWAHTTVGILKQRNAANNAWLDVLNLTTGAPVGAVAQTSPTGAVLLPQGNDAQRPGTIPPAALVVRGNTQDPADYKPEFWNRVANAWQSFASRTWATAAIAALQNTIEGWLGYTIIYPNGGNAAAPANVAINSRYVMANPFPGSKVSCRAELLYNGKWGVSGRGASATSSPSGVQADTLEDATTGEIEIVIQTANSHLIVVSAGMLSPFGYAGSPISTPLPCRVIVSKVGRPI